MKTPYSTRAWASVVASGLLGSSGCLIVVCQELYGAGKDGSIGLKVYPMSGFATAVVCPSGVTILTVVREITSAGGVLLVAQSQYGARKFCAAVTQSC